ncbi:hypothetical protein SB748_29415 [Rhizobium sp. SIMBA_035]
MLSSPAAVKLAWRHRHAKSKAGRLVGSYQAVDLRFVVDGEKLQVIDLTEREVCFNGATLPSAETQKSPGRSTQTDYPQVPPKVEYTLTEIGKARAWRAELIDLDFKLRKRLASKQS